MCLKSIKYIVEKCLKKENYRKSWFKAIEEGLELVRLVWEELFGCKGKIYPIEIDFFVFLCQYVSMSIVKPYLIVICESGIFIKVTVAVAQIDSEED